LNYSIEQTSKNRAELGALINRYSSAIDGYTMMGFNMRQARSRIKDTEYTVETSKLAKQQILAQASMAMLAQANTSKNAVIELIR
jgi:flagellin